MKTLLVLAGGFGTRLRSAVADVPKPLAPVANKPFLIHLLNNMISQGARDIILLLHYEAYKVEEMISSMKDNGLLSDIQIRTLIETTPLGTGGAILNALNVFNLKNSFVVINADTWIGSGLEEIARSKSPSIASVKINNCDRYGSLKIAKKKIVAFSEKEPNKKNNWINAGMYHLDKNNFLGFKQGSFFSLEEKILPNLAFSKKLGVVKLETEFIDIGVPEDYIRFCNWMEKEKKIEL